MLVKKPFPWLSLWNVHSKRIIIEIAYEHVLDNRFVLGGAFQFIINNLSRNYYIKTKNTEPGATYLCNDQMKSGKNYISALHSFVAGVHLGYKF